MQALKFDKLIRKLYVKGKEAKTLKRNILIESENEIRKSAEEIERGNQHELAKNLSKEIDVRYASLGNKYGIDLGNLSDYQILELSKDKTRDNEFNDILNKITSLASFLHFGREDVKSLLNDGDKKRENLAEMRGKLFRRFASGNYR